MSSNRWPDVGSQIRKARETQGWSQVELARRLHRAERSVQAWERNERTPRPKTLTQLSRILGQRVSYFYTDRDPAADDAEEPSGAVA